MKSSKSDFTFDMGIHYGAVRYPRAIGAAVFAIANRGFHDDGGVVPQCNAFSGSRMNCYLFPLAEESPDRLVNAVFVFNV